MTNILCNSQFFHQRFGGVTRYSSCLIEKMIDNRINFKICAPLYKNSYIKKIDKKYVFGIHVFKYPNILILRYIDNSISKFFLKDNKNKLIHFMYDPGYHPKSLSQKKILTIHDLIHEKFKTSYNDDFFLKRKKLLEIVDKIICVSENTKKDLIEFYNLDNKKINVIYNGGDHLNNVLTSEKNKKINEKPYILYVGSRSKYKNFRLFIESYKKSKRLVADFKIVCFGGGNFSKAEINFFEELKISNNINLISGDDATLKHYYKNASLFVYPSLYEGFGLSILEAMNTNCPVLVSDIPVFREILNDNIIFFDPKSHEDLIFKMEKILFNNDCKSELISNGKEISKKYFWANCYTQTMSLYT